MKTILLIIIAAILGGAAVFFTLRELDTSAADVDLTPIIADLERRIDERLRDQQLTAPEQTERADDRSDASDISDTRTEPRDVHTFFRADGSPFHLDHRPRIDREPTMNHSPTIDVASHRPSLEPTRQSSNPPADRDAPAADHLAQQQQAQEQPASSATERPNYRQLSEGLVEAASALERFNQTLSGDRRDDAQQQAQDQRQDQDDQDNDAQRSAGR